MTKPEPASVSAAEPSTLGILHTLPQLFIQPQGSPRIRHCSRIFPRSHGQASHARSHARSHGQALQSGQALLSTNLKSRESPALSESPGHALHSPYSHGHALLPVCSPWTGNAAIFRWDGLNLAFCNACSWFRSAMPVHGFTRMWIQTE